MQVSSFGYLGFSVSDLSRWKSFGADFLGLGVASEDDDTIKFRNDDRAWRIAAHRGDADDIAYAGFEVANADALAAIRGKLQEGGVAIEEATADLRKQRGVKDLVVCRDPDGLRVEIFYGPLEKFDTPFRSGCVASGFVTGDQGLGHIVLMTPDLPRMRAFYSGILGFKLSDTIDIPISGELTISLEFYHCNRRHHTVALGPTMGTGGKKLHHFMLQVASLDDVGFALDRVTRYGVALRNTLGRHTNDHMVSFYAATPSGFEVELGTGARTVDDEDWSVVSHEKISTWGHVPVA